jgi:hypothetical protein
MFFLRKKILRPYPTVASVAITAPRRRGTPMSCSQPQPYFITLPISLPLQFHGKITFIYTSCHPVA